VVSYHKPTWPRRALEEHLDHKVQGLYVLVSMGLLLWATSGLQVSAHDHDTNAAIGGGPTHSLLAPKVLLNYFLSDSTWSCE
jgi:hypothetical protein